MPFTLTKAQQAVVENEGGALLVSAAAGSGKTRVLIDRLLRKIADGANIDDFLIITYTNAAAAELRAKIFAALSERLAVQPENRHLQRQLTRIYLTQISTVHAFCANILRRYAHTMDLPPDFRVAEEYEMQLLRTACWTMCWRMLMRTSASSRMWRGDRPPRLWPGRPAAGRARPPAL